MMLDYDTLIEKIIETQLYGYDCTILSFFAGDYMCADKDVELGDEFAPLMLYFDTIACEDSDDFREIIDDLVAIISNGNKIDNFDINFILNKREILKMDKKFKEGYISIDYVFLKLKKYFFTEDLQTTSKMLQDRKKVSFKK